MACSAALVFEMASRCEADNAKIECIRYSYCAYQLGEEHITDCVIRHERMSLCPRDVSEWQNTKSYNVHCAQSWGLW